MSRAAEVAYESGRDARPRCSRRHASLHLARGPASSSRYPRRRGANAAQRVRRQRARSGIDTWIVASPLVFSLSESMVHAVSRLVDDWQSTREPSHSALGAAFARAGLGEGDPHADPSAPKIGKQKRVRQTLQWALDHDEASGVRGVEAVINLVRG